MISTSADTWIAFGAQTKVHSAPCVDCQKSSGWNLNGWLYRYIPIRGGKRTDPKVRYERICGDCYAERQKELSGVLG